MGNQKGLARDFKALEARRLQAISLFGRSLSKAEAARSLGVSAQSAGRWHSVWTCKGTTAPLAAERTGPYSRVKPGQRNRFEALLRTAAGSPRRADGTAWTLVRVVEAIREELGFEYHPTQLSRLLRHRGLTLGGRPSWERTEEDISTSRCLPIQVRPRKEGLSHRSRKSQATLSSSH